MESIAYLASSKFIIVAVDTIYETQFHNISIKLNDAQKAYKLSDSNLVSVIGNPYKITDIYTYLNKLTELGQNRSFEEVINDLNDVFNTSRQGFANQINDLRSMLPQFQNEKDEVDVEKMKVALTERPDLVSILEDALHSLNAEETSITQLFVFGWNDVDSLPKIANFISIGNRLEGATFTEFLPGQVFVRFASATAQAETTRKIEQEAVEQLNVLLFPGWDAEENSINKIIMEGKQILARGLAKISPYNTAANVVFYELDEKSKFAFQEPKIKLRKIIYNRSTSPG